jgi:hypothetical protein
VRTELLRQLHIININFDHILLTSGLLQAIIPSCMVINGAVLKFSYFLITIPKFSVQTGPNVSVPPKPVNFLALTDPPNDSAEFGIASHSFFALIG